MVLVVSSMDYQEILLQIASLGAMTVCTVKKDLEQTDNYHYICMVHTVGLLQSFW
jgi:predicted SprT family Zn-dependent metalloprotease